MGGCRCTFRDCTVNTTNSPGAHFFHYPCRDWDRCKTWAQNAGTRDFLKLDVNKLRNKVVCEKHFRDECFMNYKKDRLVQKAIPTLLRLADGSVLDYADGENPTPKFLSPTKLQHLLPPEQLLSPEHLLPPGTSGATPNQVVKCGVDGLNEGPPVAKRTKLPPPRILNVAAPQNVSLHNIQVELPKIDEDDNEEFILEAVGDHDESDIELNVVAEVTSDSANEKNDELFKSMLAEKELEFTTEVATLKAEADAKNVLLVSMQAEIEYLKGQVAESQSQIAVTQVKTISTSMKADGPSAAAPLTKAQLFNGIKKYLSPSMASMVRMEMFGGPEREWKKDEKNVAVELLSLGGHVFDYIRDEWRCRLPPKKDVEQWLSQRNELEDEEDL